MAGQSHAHSGRLIFRPSGLSGTWTWTFPSPADQPSHLICCPFRSRLKAGLVFRDSCCTKFYRIPLIGQIIPYPGLDGHCEPFVSLSPQLRKGFLTNSTLYPIANSFFGIQRQGTFHTKQLSVPPCPDAGVFFYHQPDDTLDLSTFTFTMSIRATNLPPFLHRAGKNIQDGDGVLPSDARVCDTDAVLEAALAFLWDLLVTCICVSVFQRLTEADGVPTYLRRCCSQS